MPCVNTNLIYLFIMKAGRKTLPIAAGSFKAISELKKGNTFGAIGEALQTWDNVNQNEKRRNISKDIKAYNNAGNRNGATNVDAFRSASTKSVFEGGSINDV